MSRKATDWAREVVKGLGLTCAQKIVLGELADRHNPDLGCFPSQARLAEDSELSRSQTNLILNVLERKGLIRRYPEWDEKTKRQKVTRYRLAFEPGFEPLSSDDPSSEVQGTLDLPNAELSPKIGHGNRGKAVSEKTPNPCPAHKTGTCKGTCKGTFRGGRRN